MTGAFLYLFAVSLKNLVLSWVKRLREPKYLVFALVGGSYIYFFLVRYWIGSGFRHAFHGGFGPERNTLLLLAALFLTSLAFLVWIYPSKKIKLFFTEADISFLFPAPITRRSLFHYALVKSQIGILFSSLIFSLFVSRLLHQPFPLTYAGMWIVFTTMSLHSKAVSFSKASMIEHGFSGIGRNLLFAAVPLAAIAFSGIWLAVHFPVLPPGPFSESTFSLYLEKILGGGPLPYVLYPAKKIAAPLLADGRLAFMKALGPALLILAIHYLWLFRMNVSFEEAAIAYSARLASRIEARKRGMPAISENAASSLKPRRTPFTLKPAGRLESAFFWKNLIAESRMFSARALLTVVVLLVVLTSVIGKANNESPPLVAGFLFLFGAAFLLVIGPSLFKHDLRKDIIHIERLLSYPVPGFSIVMGEVLSPLVISTILTWLFLACGVSCMATVAPSSRDMAATLLPIALAAAVCTPGFLLMGILLANAFVIFFPGWSLAVHGPTSFGVERIGQRLVFAFVSLLAFALLLLPAAVVLGLSFLLGAASLGPWTLLLASPVACVLLFAEGWVGIHLLGIALDRLDPSNIMGSGA
jgi:hypothetical protein